MIAIYARVSTEEQAKHGFSLADQIRGCQKKAGTNETLNYVDEGISGEFLDRPALTRLRQDVRSGLINKVICLDPDRLSRKLMNQLIVSDEIETRAEIVFVNGEYGRTPEGQLFYQMRGAISQFEKAKINERMSRGRREKARQGKVLRDFHIYGYDYDNETEQFIINEREATIVRLIFDLFVNPQGRVKGINGIAKYLTELGVPTKRGARVFHRQVVRQMLMNRAYVGEFYQNKWNTEGMLGNKFRPPDERIPQKERPKEEWIRLSIPSIIETEQFALAQSLLTESRRRWAGTKKHQYLLSGILRCGECGNTMTGCKHRNWGKEVYVYNDRKSTAGAKYPGCGTKVTCDELEEKAWNTILSWMNSLDENIDLVLDCESSTSFERSQLRDIQQELERIETAQDRIWGFLGEPDIDELDIREKLKELQRRKKQLQKERKKIMDKNEETPNIDIKHKKQILQEAWATLKATPFEKLDFNAKQELIRSIVKEIRVYEQGERIDIFTL